MTAPIGPAGDPEQERSTFIFHLLEPVRRHPQVESIKD
jgi:hypothetical protein